MTLDLISLPPEILQKIMMNLPPPALCRCARVSNYFKTIADNDHVWKYKLTEKNVKEWSGQVFAKFAFKCYFQSQPPRVKLPPLPLNLKDLPIVPNGMF